MKRRFFESIIETILKLSGSVTSIAILLIVVFLFREGLGIFSEKRVEDGYVLAVNANNRVHSLTSFQIKEIFDANITQWNEVGGADEPILPFRLNDITQYVSEEEIGAEMENLPAALSRVVDSIPGIIAFFPKAYLDPNFKGRVFPEENISGSDFFLGREWYPTAQPVAQYGVLPLITGTLWVSFWAILIALPFGLAVAIYLAEIAHERVRRIMKPLIELLSGIPSVVYGFFGLVVLVPLIQKTFNLPVGETALAGSVILAIMALPTMITVAEDAMRNTPRSMKEASLALGASHWQTIYKVVIPNSLSGISAAVVLGIGRAIGETMAVLMVTGNAAVMPHTLLEPVRTIPATIAAELGEAPAGGVHYQALFTLGCILFLITLIVSISVEMISRKRRYA